MSLRRHVGRLLPPAIRVRLRSRLPARMVWGVPDVADATGPAYNVRCYLERRTLRELVGPAVGGRIPLGVEVGCGYGRMTMLLGEYCDRVIGLEREASLLELARPLLPEIEFVETPDLRTLPLEGGSAGLLMTFTVLQHLPDEHARSVVDEIKRAAAPGALVVVMEKTDTSAPYSWTGDLTNSDQLLSIGRTVATYTEWMAPYELVSQREGRVEPTYPGYDRVGTYMLFRAPV